MAEVKIMKAVEFDKCAAAFKKKHGSVESLWSAGWLMQKKYDGCFGMAIIRGNGFNQMLSRTGEDYTASCGHILRELEEAATEQSPSWDEFVVLGEVWHPTLGFPTISGKFRKRATSDLRFVANDLLPIELNTDRPYGQRLNDLHSLLPEMEGAYTSVAETVQFDLERTAMQVACELKESGGFDGAILRDCRAGYKIGLVKQGEIVKVKPSLSLDLICESIICGVGGVTGRPVFTMRVTYKGVETIVGSGMPHDADALPKVGQIVEVEAMGLTPDGKLREPRYKGTRFDKEEPDT